MEGLALIGESINDSVPSTRKLFEAGELDALVELARFQDQRGADYIDVNIGSREPGLMAELVRRIQQATTRPLSIDTPDAAIARAGLETYDPERAGGRGPILNSITTARVHMFELFAIRPFRPILLVSEHLLDGQARPCRTAEESFQTARALVRAFRETCPGATNDDCILDPGIFPLGSDSEGQLHRVFGVLESVRNEAELAGVHVSVGLSNFTVMLPARRRDGSPVKSALENAFLTRAVPLGLDMIIGSVRRGYKLLPEGHPALECLDDCLKLSGFDVLMRVREFYAGA